MVLIKFLAFALLIIIILTASWYENRKQLHLLVKNTSQIMTDNEFWNRISELIAKKEEIPDDLYRKINIELDVNVTNLGVVLSCNNPDDIMFDKVCENKVIFKRKIYSFLNKKNLNPVKIEQYNNQNLILIRGLYIEKIQCIAIVTNRKKADLWNDLVSRK